MVFGDAPVASEGFGKGKPRPPFVDHFPSESHGGSASILVYPRVVVDVPTKVYHKNKNVINAC